jgi:hypothetical protein
MRLRLGALDHRFFPGFRLAHDLEAFGTGEHAPEPGSEQGVVVGYENARALLLRR